MSFGSFGFGSFGFGGEHRGVDWTARAELATAVEEGQVEKATKLMNSLGLTNPESWADDDGYDLLCDALKHKQAAVAKLLIENGVNVTSNLLDPWTRDTPLHYAVENGIPIEVVKMILEHGAEIDAKDDFGRTPLYDAIIDKKLDHAKLLLEHGADVEARDNLGACLLHVAVQKGGLPFVEQLLHYGAYINCIYSKIWKGGFTPLHFAVEKADKEVIKLLLSKGADVDITDDFGRTPLHIACQQRNADGDIVAMLLDYGSNVSMKCANDHTPLNYATAEVVGTDRISYNVATKVLTRYIVQMKTANFNLSISNGLLQNFNEDISDFRDQCEKEIEVMKFETINNTNISFYEILVKETSLIAKYMRNKTIVEAFNSKDYTDKFPIYAKMLESRVRMGMERKELVERGVKIFDKLSPKLPLICAEEIFSYLNVQELRILCHAGRSYWLSESELPNYIT